MAHYGGVGTTQYGIRSEPNAVDYLYNMAVSDNVFYVYAGGIGIDLNGLAQSTIGINTFIGQTGTTTGIRFGDGTGPNVVMPQNMYNIDTLYSGVATAETFVPGIRRTFAGDPNNNITPNYIGEECLDTTNNKWYKAFGAAGNQWAALN